MGSGGVAIAALPTVICLKVSFSDGLGGKSKTRQSNIELLRIIAMFLVLILHSGFSTVKSPTTPEVHEQFLQPFTRFLFESLSIACVDIFVLISGWFGIRPTKKRLLNFLFQSFYFIIGVYLVMVALGLSPISIKGIASCFLFLQDYDYWFVRTYLLLFIMSSILNAFIESADKKIFRYVLIGFFLFQTIYAWGFVAVNAFAADIPRFRSWDYTCWRDMRRYTNQSGA